MHRASLSGLKFVCGDLSVTTCNPEFSSVMLSEHYHFFLSGGRHKHTIYYELEAVTDLDLGGERKRLWKDNSGDFPLRISNFENKFQALKKKMAWLLRTGTPFTNTSCLHSLGPNFQKQQQKRSWQKSKGQWLLNSFQAQLYNVNEKSPAVL